MGTTNEELKRKLVAEQGSVQDRLKYKVRDALPVNSALRQAYRTMRGGPTSVTRGRFLESETAVIPALEEYTRKLMPNADDAAIEYRVSRRRIWKARNEIVPWLQKSLSLEGAKVLEIGCGSGSNAVAYAEQGAEVTGADIDTEALIVARERARLYGVDCAFLDANAAEIDQHVDLSSFDLVVYYASLEHMTIEERGATMKQSWSALKPGAHWSLVETPNRLWVRDGHTSWLPFFHWLPDELAMPYLAKSPKPRLQALAEETDPLILQRRGRGVSFHEFDLFMQDSASLDVVSSLHSTRKYGPKSQAQKFTALLSGMRPELHQGFFHENLDLIIRKH